MHDRKKPSDQVSANTHEDDARRFLDAMRERFAAFSLSLHPLKTRVIEFGRRAAVNRTNRGVSRPDTFAFLGFTFICSKSRRGFFQLQRKTRRDRMRAKLQEIRRSCGGECTRLSQIRVTGCGRLLQAISLTMRYPQIVGRSRRSGIT